MQIPTHTSTNTVSTKRGSADWEPWWKLILRRFFIMNVGMLVMSLGIVAIIRANIGASSWDVLHLGIVKHTSLSYGVVQQIVGLVLLLVASLWAKKIPTLGTFYNIIMTGVFCNWFLLLIPEQSFFGWQWLQFAVGLLLCGYGTGMYISSKLGAGSRDWLMLLLHEKTGLSVKWIRTILEVSVVLLGLVLGGPFSVGTILFSLLIGHPTEWGLNLSKRVFGSFVERRGYQDEIVN